MHGKVGLDCKLYYSAVDESPTWIELVAIDVAFGKEVQNAEMSNRSSAYVKSLPHLIDQTLTFNMIYDSADSAMLAVIAACDSRTVLMFAILSGDEEASDTTGNIIHAFVSRADENQPLKEGVTVSFEAKLAYGHPDPTAWAE